MTMHLCQARADRKKPTVCGPLQHRAWNVWILPPTDSQVRRSMLTSCLYRTRFWEQRGE